MLLRADLTTGQICRAQRYRTAVIALAILAGMQGPALAQITPKATYGYDTAGDTVTIVYTDQTCVVHTYDSSGNRIATSITKADVPETPVWGGGVWGCNEWTP